MINHEAETHKQQRVDSQRLVADLQHGRISRRDFMARAAALGFSAAAINIFLIACGGSPTATVAPAAPSTAPSAAASAAPSVAASAAASAAPSAAASAAAPSVAASAAASASAAPAASASSSAAPATPASSAAAGGPIAGIATAQGTLLGGPIAANAVLADQQFLNYPFTELTQGDPGLMTAVLEVQFALACWDALVTSNQLGNPQPAHATKYDISADGLKYTFTLRSGLKWSDGTPLTAKDYEWTWKRNLDPALASEYAQALYPIKGATEYNTGKTTDPNTVLVKAASDTSLEVTLADPAPYFLALVSTWTYVPLQRATIEKNKEKWIEAGNMVTAGKYKLQTWEHDKQMVIVPDPNYYGEKPSLQKITFIIYKDLAASALPAYEKGEIDVVTALSPDDLARVKGDAKLKNELNLLPVSGTSFVVFDVTNTKSPVGKKEFRQAVNQAINRDRLNNDILKGQFASTATFAPKGILGHIDQPPTPVNLKGDVTKAKALLQAAGYKGEEVVYTHSDATRPKTIAQAIQQDLKDAGINVRLDVLEAKAYSAWRTARKDQAFDMYVGGWFSDYEDPNNWYNFFWGDPNQGFWHDKFSKSATGKSFTDLIIKANTEADRKKREEMYIQAEKILLDELPIVPIYSNQDVVMVKPYVKGLVHTNLAQDLFGGVKILKR